MRELVAPHEPAPHSRRAEWNKNMKDALFSASKPHLPPKPWEDKAHASACSAHAVRRAIDTYFARLSVAFYANN